MQIFVCKLAVLLSAIGNNAAKPKQCLSATGTTKMLLQAGRIMKLTAVLLLGVCMQIYAAGYGQKITLSERDVPIEKVLKKIQAQTSYKFLYTSQLLSGVPKVTVVVKDATVQDVLDLVLKGQMLDYEVSDETVVIKPKARTKSLASVDEVTQGPIDVSGKVTDGEGRPLPGANVKVRGTSIGVTTDNNGLFVLKNVSENAILEISFVGHEMKTFTVRGGGFVTVALDQKLSMLDETVVIAYGSTTKRFNTGNISGIKASDIEKQSNQNPLTALQGRVPGVYVTQNTGIANGGVTVRIQGQNSIAKGNDPLYIIDGVPYISQLPRTGIDNVLGSSGMIGFSGNPLSYISSSEIESIEVLKDADATAIYGSRAANGAILITTKKGKSGKISINFDLQNGWGKVPKYQKMLNTQQYLEMRYEAFKNDGVDWKSNSVVAPDLKQWDTTRDTNWQKKLLGGTANFQNFSMAFSGGSPHLQFLLSANYSKSTTVFPVPKDFSDIKGSVFLSLNAISNNQRLSIKLTTSYLFDKNRLPSVDLTQSALMTEPNAPTLYNQYGALNWELDKNGATTFYNPLAPLIAKYVNTTKNQITNLLISYKLFKYFDVKLSTGYTNMNTVDFIPHPLTSIKPEDRIRSNRQADYGERTITSTVLEPQVTFRKSFRGSTLDLLAGGTYLKNYSNSGYLTGFGHPNDDMLNSIHSATTITTGSSFLSEYKYIAAYGRINYNHNGKYVLNITMRRDGSSRFGDANKFKTFGSIAGAWIITEEPLFKKAESAISFGKIWGSFGVTGNDQIGDYNYMSLYGLQSNAPVAYQGIPSLSPGGLPNEKLEWETNKKYQGGIDLGMLNDKIILSVVYATNKSSNQLLRSQLPTLTGFSSFTSNFPATVENKSIEISLNATLQKSRNWTWSSNFNLTLPKNKLVSFPNIETSTYANELIVGQAINVLRAWSFHSVDPGSGRYQFSDSKGDPTFTPQFPQDATAIINTVPKFYGGLANSLSYKNLTLDFLLQFVKQDGMRRYFNNGGATPPGVFSYGLSNQPVAVLNRWQGPGNSSEIAKFTTDFGPAFTDLMRAQNSSLGFEDASFLRVKSVSLSCRIPNEILNKIKMKSCMVYLNGQNLLTFTKYSGLDAENMSINSLPPLRVIMIGLKASL